MAAMRKLRRSVETVVERQLWAVSDNLFSDMFGLGLSDW
jgi:hypothetical protein